MRVEISDLIFIGISLLFVFISYSIGWIKNKEIKRIVKIVWFLFMMFVLILIIFEIISVFHEPELIIEKI